MNIPLVVFCTVLEEDFKGGLELSIMRARLLSEDPPEYSFQCGGPLSLEDVYLIRDEGKIIEFLYNNQGRYFKVPDLYDLAQKELKVSERAVSEALIYLDGWLYRTGNNRLISEEAKIGFRENRLVVI